MDSAVLNTQQKPLQRPQTNENLNGPRVSFNKDVHVKRIGNNIHTHTHIHTHCIKCDASSIYISKFKYRKSNQYETHKIIAITIRWQTKPGPVKSHTNRIDLSNGKKNTSEWWICDYIMHFCNVYMHRIYGTESCTANRLNWWLAQIQWHGISFCNRKLRVNEMKWKKSDIHFQERRL